MNTGVGNLLVLMLVCSFSAYGNPVMQPGAWASNMKTTAINPNTGKKVNVANVSTTACLTKNFLATDPYLSGGINMEKMKRKGASCSNSDYSNSGKSASWVMSCTMANGKNVISKISASVAKNKYTIKMDQVVGEGASAVRVTNIVTSRHAGKCTSSMMRP